jgi:hypothetical protein
LPQIKRFLAESGLDFLGFDLPPDVRQAYAAQYPDDRSRTDLDRWNEFETQNPATFAGMYQFWAQRAP